MPQNREALEIWPIVRFQVVTAGMGGVIDLNHLAIWKDLEEVGVENKTDCFRKIMILFNHFMEEGLYGGKD